jgi:valyl-tRNA synthetase
MPFITEELWQQLYERKEGESIMTSLLVWDNNKIDETFISQFEKIKEIIGNVRTVRLQKNIAWKEVLELQIIGDNPVEKLNAIIIKMCNLSTIATTSLKAKGAASFIVGTTEFAVPLGNLIDVEAEIIRIEAELKHKKEFLQDVWKKLNNEKFVTNAPPAVLETERKKQADAESIIKSLKESLDTLKKSL